MKQERVAFIALPGRGGHSGLMLLRLFNHPGAGSEEFYSVQGAMCHQLMDIFGLVGIKVTFQASLIFLFQPV